MDQGAAARPTVVVTVGGRRHELSGDDELTFGRASGCTVCLDPDDTGISRLAGSVRAEGGTWWLTNRSTTRQLAVVDELGLRSVLPPGRRWPLDGRMRVLVDGSAGSHTLEVQAPHPAAVPGDVALPGAPTAIGEEVLIRAPDRLALVALFSGYLEEGGRYQPHPKTYAAAAARLGWPQTTLLRRIEHLRVRLDKAGVPNMMGWNAMTNLAEYVLTTGIITRDDLHLISR
ncbi:MAG: hypothetical protein ACRDTC_22560 [Pseudonocardiaceae bacterium]